MLKSLNIHSIYLPKILLFRKVDYSQKLKFQVITQETKVETVIFQLHFKVIIRLNLHKLKTTRIYICIERMYMMS